MVHNILSRDIHWHTTELGLGVGTTGKIIDNIHSTTSTCHAQVMGRVLGVNIMDI